MKRLPEAAVYRGLSIMDTAAANDEGQVSRALIPARPIQTNPTWITPDFEAVGYKDKKKGQCSYYPLCCTIAQIGKLFYVLHRAGSVHDSNGARSLSIEGFPKAILSNVITEVRMKVRS